MLLVVFLQIHDRHPLKGIAYVIIHVVNSGCFGAWRDLVNLMKISMYSMTSSGWLAKVH